MSNSFGKAFSVSTWGESHGSAVGCVVDGCPAGLKISIEDIQRELDRRRPGQGPLATPRKEKDEVRVLSGIFEGRTLGTPISMVVMNRDADSSAYKSLINRPRPGHADLTWQEKFRIRDWRGGGRASARETVGRVAAGAIAARLLSTLGIRIVAFSREIAGIDCGDVKINDADKLEKIIYSNGARSPGRAAEMEKAIVAAKRDGDSVGGVVECVALNVPAGLGEPVFDKLNAELAKAVCSIPAVRGVEFGLGFESARMRGSEVNDAFEMKDNKIATKSNNAGGINGGISNGMPIVLRAAVKPTASISLEQETVDLKSGKNAKIRIDGRHDPCIVPRAVPVVKAMVALVLADMAIRNGSIPRSLV